MKSLVEHVHAVLSTTPERWQRLVSTLPIDLLTRPPAAGEWSAHHCTITISDGVTMGAVRGVGFVSLRGSYHTTRCFSKAFLKDELSY